MIVRSLVKKLIHPFLKLGYNLYYLKPRPYRYHDIEVLVHPKVFSPKFTISTKILLDYIDALTLKNISFLELGCGSGIISLLAASKGAMVTASDINNFALEALKKTSQKNNLPLSIVYSDLFDEITQEHFDYIIINPPYYPRKPKNEKEHAWFCGENFEYFYKLFNQLPNYIHKNIVLMILSEDCNISHIKKIASENGLTMRCIFEKTVVKEKNFIFSIEIS
ncbi:methyltransferase [Aquimarina rhabdastrellae]